MPKAKQLTVSVENRPGKLGEVGSALGAKKVNIVAFMATVADKSGHHPGDRGQAGRGKTGLCGASLGNDRRGSFGSRASRQPWQPWENRAQAARGQRQYPLCVRGFGAEPSAGHGVFWRLGSEGRVDRGSLKPHRWGKLLTEGAPEQHGVGPVLAGGAERQQ